MELDPFGRILPMAESHHDAILGLRADFQTLRNVGDHERVISRGRESLGQPSEQRFRIMKNRAGLAVHQRRRAHHFSAIDLSDRLMAKDHAVYRYVTLKALLD